jgi:hypothetical protein
MLGSPGRLSASDTGTLMPFRYLAHGCSHQVRRRSPHLGLIHEGDLAIGV